MFDARRVFDENEVRMETVDDFVQQIFFWNVLIYVCIKSISISNLYPYQIQTKSKKKPKQSLCHKKYRMKSLDSNREFFHLLRSPVSEFETKLDPHHCDDVYQILC